MTKDLNSSAFFVDYCGNRFKNIESLLPSQPRKQADEFI